MPTFTPKRYPQILRRMVAGVVSKTDLTDLTDSSVVKHILSAAAREDDDQYNQMQRLRALFNLDTAEGEDLDERAREVFPTGPDRTLEVKAVGNVTFSRPGTSGTVVIPVGTVVKTGSAVEFETTDQGEIVGGASTSADVPIVAKVGGDDGNVSAGTITLFGTRVPGVTGVTNGAATTGGRDEESDASFRQRLRDFVSTLSRSTPLALEFGAKLAILESGQKVEYAKTVEDIILRGEVTLYVDDGSGGIETTAVVVGENLTAGLAGPPADSAVGGEEFLYADNKPIKPGTALTVTSSTRGALVEDTDFVLNRADGQFKFTPALSAAEVITIDYTYFTGLIQLAQKIIDGDPDDRTNFPGWRAAGVRVAVLPPLVLNQSVTGTLVVDESFDKSAIITEVESLISAYINSLGIGDDVIRNKIIDQAMGVGGVRDISLTTPAANVTILDSELARTNTGIISIT